MQIAVIFGTVEGQTRRIAEGLAAVLRARGDSVDCQEAGPAAAAAIEAADAAILLAPVHVGRYPSAVVQLARDAAARLNAIPSAFVSVSLGIVGEEAERREVQEIPARLFDETGWHPAAVHHAAGALKFTEYDFFRRWIMRSIARLHGYGEGDREFTDWAALARFADDFPPRP